MNANYCVTLLMSTKSTCYALWICACLWLHWVAALDITSLIGVSKLFSWKPVWGLGTEFMMLMIVCQCVAFTWSQFHDVDMNAFCKSIWKLCKYYIDCLFINVKKRKWGEINYACTTTHYSDIKWQTWICITTFTKKETILFNLSIACNIYSYECSTGKTQCPWTMNITWQNSWR